MAERNWRDEFEEEDRDGDMVIDVWYRNGRALGYATKFAEKEIVCDASHLVPKPKPAPYRPYKRGEVLVGSVVEHKTTGTKYLIILADEYGIMAGTSSFTYHGALENLIHIDGTPAGVKE